MILIVTSMGGVYADISLKDIISAFNIIRKLLLIAIMSMNY